MKKLVLYSAIILFLTSCSSQLDVAKIPNNLPSGSEVDGIPFRVTKRFKATVYKKTQIGYEKITMDEPLFITAPDPYNLYVVGFDALMLADSSFAVDVDPEKNTLNKISLKSIAKAGQALDNAGTQLNAVALAQEKSDEAAKNRRDSLVKERKDAETANNTDYDLVLASDKAKQAADLAELQYEIAKKDPSTLAVDILKAEQSARSAKLDANRAARLAHRPPYFPDIIP